MYMEKVLSIPTPKEIKVRLLKDMNALNLFRGWSGGGYVTKITDGEHTVESMAKSSEESKSRACLSKQHKTNKGKN